MKLIGPFKQLLTMDSLPLKGSLPDSRLEIIPDGGILLSKGKILKTGNFYDLEASYNPSEVERINSAYVALPGFIDAHTHICWAGSRANDFAHRLNGKSYLEIAEIGGGIWNTVSATREATLNELAQLTIERANELLKQGVSVIEVKSGYGLSVEEEIKILKAIKKADDGCNPDLISTCLAAHILPDDFQGNNIEYLDYIVSGLFPEVIEQNLSNRTDIFIDSCAFTLKEAEYYIKKAKEHVFDIVIHGDQFSSGAAQLAVETGAISIDHLEAAGDEEIEILSKGDVFPVVLPCSSLGLGESFAPARKILDSGSSLVIASDWNPGSAPMGNLMTGASIIGIKEKLTMAEILAAITFRAAAALRLSNRGILKQGFQADLIAFKTDNLKDIIYYQGSLKPSMVWKNGFCVLNKNKY